MEREAVLNDFRRFEQLDQQMNLSNATRNRDESALVAEAAMGPEVRIMEFSCLDQDDTRPELKKEKELIANLECKICYTQQSSVAVLPCG